MNRQAEQCALVAAGAFIGTLTTALYLKSKEKRLHVALVDAETAKTETDVAGEHLHWVPGIQRRGLGEFCHRLNHVALIVRDVGVSLAFYSDIIGFQQIRRPNFDRHGAWLTMGNVELHLIKGAPSVTRGDHPSDLIVSHLAVEINDADAVLQRLQAMQQTEFQRLKWRQNISVPTSQTSRAEKFEGDHQSSKGKISQFFLEDPDGYWLELCNCEELTAFCLGHDDVVMPTVYDEGFKCQNVSSLAMVDVKVNKWIARALQSLANRDEISEKIYEMDPISSLDVNKEYLDNLIKRKNTYGDICQGFTDDELTTFLAQTHNNVPDAILLMTEKRAQTGQVFMPPAFLDNSEQRHSTEAFTMKAHSQTLDWLLESGEVAKSTHGEHCQHEKRSAKYNARQQLINKRAAI